MSSNAQTFIRKALVAAAASTALASASYAVACGEETGSTATPATPTAPSTSPSTSPSVSSPINLVGVNLAGAEFAHHIVPGTYGKEYTYPTEANFKRYSDLGMKLIRLPFRWERVQPTLGTALNTAEMDRMMTALGYAQKHGLQVILDMHNYYRYYEKLIGTSQVPISQFANTWKLLAQKVVNHPAVYGYGLMNEPYSTNGLWPQAAQAAAQAIRGVDKNRWIFVAGDRWSSAYHWPSYNTKLIANPWMRDLNNKLVFEAHMYIDKDFSGKYANKGETFDPMIGVNRVKPFVEWLKQNNLRGYIGEHGVPDWSPSAIKATDNLLSYLRENCIPSTYWAGGPWWGEYALALDVRSGKARPQLPVLQKHAQYKTCSTIGPAK